MVYSKISVCHRRPPSMGLNRTGEGRQKIGQSHGIVGQETNITTTDCQICCLTLRIRLPVGYRGSLIASRCQVQIVRENRPARGTVVVILRLIHFSMLTIQHLLMGSRMAAHDAFQALVQADKDMESGITSFGFTLGNPLYDKNFHYGLPTREELQNMTREQLEEALRECADPMFGAAHEDPEDEKSRIIHWMPTDIRWLHMTLVQNEIDRRSDKRNRQNTIFLACVAIGISVAALTVTTLVAL